MGSGPGVLETPSYICGMVFAIFLVVSLLLDKVGFSSGVRELAIGNGFDD